MLLNQTLQLPELPTATHTDGVRADVTEKKPPRIAYLVSRYPAISHTFILREVRQLRERGFDIEVASINPPDRAVADMTPVEREEAGRAYTVKRHGIVGAIAAHLWGMTRPLAWLRGLYGAIRLGGSNPFHILYNIFYFTEALMLWRWMTAHRLSHLHVHFATAAANVALLLKNFAPIRLSLTVHGPDEFYDAPGQHLREKIAAADFIICIGSYARSQLMQLSPAEHWHKFDVCPLGVDPQRFSPQQATQPKQPFTILCVGRLVPAKGQRILIEACHKLIEAGHALRLVLIGTGPDEAGLKAAVAEHDLEQSIKFTGPLNETDVRAWYARANAFALASFAEGIPVVLMEAMASGLPCVSTRITGIPELIRDGVDGLLVSPSDVDELAMALACLIESPDLCEELGRSGRARVQERYNLAANTARLGRIFEARLVAANP
jgi:glycosyltransferase involved in cell wall biosynthesis